MNAGKGRFSQKSVATKSLQIVVTGSISEYLKPYNLLPPKNKKPPQAVDIYGLTEV